MRITDRNSGCCGTSGTLQDTINLYVEAPCAADSDPSVGSTCAVSTTAEAFVPGMVPEGKRTVWEIEGNIRVHDGGPYGDGNGAVLIATPGLFVP
jgi:hypothetical protein